MHHAVSAVLKGLDKKVDIDLCTAPATKSALQVHRVLCLPRNLHSGFTKCCACHTNGSRRPATTVRAAAGPGGSVYCACHETPGSQSAVPATQQRPHAPPLVREALCTAPATKSALRALRNMVRLVMAHRTVRNGKTWHISFDTYTHDSIKEPRGWLAYRFCFNPLEVDIIQCDVTCIESESGCDSESQQSWRLKLKFRDVPTSNMKLPWSDRMREFATWFFQQTGSGWCCKLYLRCARHTNGSSGPPATTRAAGPGGSVYTVPATKPALQVHRVLCLPRKRHMCDHARRSSQSAAPAAQKAAAAQRRQRAPPLVREALCTAPATKPALRALCLPHKRQPRPGGEIYTTGRWCNMSGVR